MGLWLLRRGGDQLGPPPVVLQVPQGPQHWSPGDARGDRIRLPSRGRTLGRSPGPRVRHRPSRPTQPASAQKAPAGESQEDEEDPIAQELEDARAYHSWVRQQKARVRDKELPAAEERLAKAETADKQRKPPGERLQSALSRVAHRPDAGHCSHGGGGSCRGSSPDGKEGGRPGPPEVGRGTARARSGSASPQGLGAGCTGRVPWRAGLLPWRPLDPGPEERPGGALQQVLGNGSGDSCCTGFSRCRASSRILQSRSQRGALPRMAPSDGGKGNTTPRREPADRSRSRPRDGDKAADAKRRHLNKDPPADPEDKDKEMSPGDI